MESKASRKLPHETKVRKIHGEASPGNYGRWQMKSRCLCETTRATMHFLRSSGIGFQFERRPSHQGVNIHLTFIDIVDCCNSL